MAKNLHILQYLVFDNEGKKILEGGACTFENSKDLMEMRDIMVENYHNRTQNFQLMLIYNNNENGKKVLFNSKEEKTNVDR